MGGKYLIRKVNLELRTKIKEELALVPPIKLEGWTTWEHGLELALLVLRETPQVIVEIGVFGGRSLISQALCLKHNGSGKIYGIDSWKVDDTLEGENPENQHWWKSVDLHAIHKGCMDAIYRLNLQDVAIIIRAASKDAHSLFYGNQIDILHIDGNHSEIASCRDVSLYVPLVKKGGYVWFDDADWPSTKKALSLIEETCTLKGDYKSYRLYRKTE